MSQIFSIAIQFSPTNSGAKWSLISELTGVLNIVIPTPKVPSSAVTTQMDVSSHGGAQRSPSLLYLGYRDIGVATWSTHFQLSRTGLSDVGDGNFPASAFMLLIFIA